MLHLIALEDNVLELLGCLLNLGGEEEAGRRDLQRERGRERERKREKGVSCPYGPEIEYIHV